MICDRAQYLSPLQGLEQTGDFKPIFLNLVFAQSLQYMSPFCTLQRLCYRPGCVIDWKHFLSNYSLGRLGEILALPNYSFKSANVTKYVNLGMKTREKHMNCSVH